MAEALPITLTTPIQYAKGVGPMRAAQLLAMGLGTCGDLLNYYPRDYLTVVAEAPVGTLLPGTLATIRGTLLQTRLIPRRPRRFEALLEDASGGRVVLTWFNMHGLERTLQPGMRVRVTGKITVFRERRQITQPQYVVLAGEEAEGAGDAVGARIEAVYPANAELTTHMIGRLVGAVLEPLVSQVAEWFGEGYLRERNLFTRREALRKIHRPGVAQDHVRARRTLAYHEFFLHQAAVAIKRYHARNGSPALALRVDEKVDGRIRALLPFALTAAQDRVIASIRKDLAASKPMNRLLQGDVGSGKTVVALYAMLAAVATRRGEEKRETRNAKRETGEDGGGSESADGATESGVRGFVGHQAALMAPTEILAEQHFLTLQALLAGKKVRIGLLTGSLGAREKAGLLKEIAEGTVGIVVGTHALLSEAVRFKSLAVVVIDEQHKFGVEQRSAIRTRPAESGITPHVLVMTATPIPRTLAMTAFGDLDVSVIDELPPGRQVIHTKATPGGMREEVYRWMGPRLKAGEQAFVVLPAIDDRDAEPMWGVEGGSQKPEARSGEADGGVQNAEFRIQNSLRTVVATQRELQGDWLKEFRVGLIHGRMAAETRQHIMERFRQHLIDVLVATTVIEVGVDVPNATMMVVEHADRFGLSQLHQLRGRVGRGTKQSYCILLGDQSTDEAVARLQAMVKHASGFKIAEEDLKLRGMGQLIGTAQSGSTDFHFADLLFDPALLPLSRRDAFGAIAADPRLLDAGHGEIRRELLGRFGETITLADVG